MLTIVTPTCDQPTGMRLAELFMQRQTVQPDEWIVVDDGIKPARLSMGQVHVKRVREPGCTPAQSLCRNLLAAIPFVRGDNIVFWEHDDYVAPTHLETIVGMLTDQILLAGDDQQRYYNVAHRCWRFFDNVGASLCQTGMRRELLPTFEAAAKLCLKVAQSHVDFTLWQAVPAHQQALRRTDTVVGIKGLPGRPGLGIGHRPSGPKWIPDPDLAKLRALIGEDAAIYERFAVGARQCAVL